MLDAAEVRGFAARGELRLVQAPQGAQDFSASVEVVHAQNPASWSLRASTASNAPGMLEASFETFCTKAR